MNSLIRVRFFDDESWLSLASRMAFANGRRSMRGFLSDLGLSAFGITRGEPSQVDRLANLSGVSSAALLARTVSTTGQESTLAGDVFGKNEFVRTVFRVCPHCLSEDEADSSRMPGTRRYARLTWMVSSLSVCCRHDAALTPIGKQASIPDFCRTLASSEPDLERARQAPPVHGNPFETFVSERMLGNRRHGDFLDATSLPAAIDLCQLLGAALVDGADFKTYKRERGRTREMQATGFEALSGGVEGIRSALERVVRTDADCTRRGGTALYGSLYTALKRGRQQREYDAFRSIVRDHALEKSVRPGTDIFGKLESTGFVTVNGIARSAGTNHDLVRRYLIDRGLKSPATVALIGSEGAALASRVLGDAITLPQAARILGLSVMDTRRISSSGLLPSILGGAGFKSRISETRANELRARLDDCRNVDGEGLVSLKYLSKPIVSGHADMLRAVFDGRLTRVFYDVQKPFLLDRLFVDLRELIEAKTDITVTPKFILRFLGLNATTLARLVTIGAFPNAIVRGTVIPANDVAAFSRKYVATARVGRRVTLRGLAESGIDLAFPYPETGQMILCREDVERLP